MRTLHNYIAASKQRREDGEAGFSLIELIVVVAILGILVAIAIPVFGGIQDNAKQAAADTNAANAATQMAAELATDADLTASTVLAADAAFFDNLAATITVKTDGDLDDFCLTASLDGKTGDSGPGC